MNTRRNFLTTAAMAIAGLGFCHRAHARFSGVVGCCILPGSGTDFAISSPNQPEHEPTAEDLLESMTLHSGLGRDFEYELGRVLAQMSNLFDVNPGFGFYDDSSGRNAFAIDRKWIPQTKGTVAFGRNLLQQQMEIDRYGISVAAICAHEFAHIYQYASGFYTRIMDTQRPHCVELHADYLAGFFLNHFKDDKPSVDLNHVGVSWEEMGSADFTDPGSHGTREQRLTSIQQGYYDARDGSNSNVDSAARQGFRHVAQYV